MQGMAEFMKSGPNFIVRQQGRFAWRRFRNVQMVGHHRFGSEESALLHIGGHPRAAAFGRPRVIIPEKKRERLTIGVIHFPDAHVGLIYGKIVPLLERETIKFPGGKEDTVEQNMI